MNDERIGKCLPQVEHILGHLWHRYSITVNQVVKFSKWWLQLNQEDSKCYDEFRYKVLLCKTSDAVYEKRKLYQARLYKHNLLTISNIPYNLISETKFIDSSILVTIFSWDYLNLSLVNEYVGDVTKPTQVIKYNQYFLQADQPIRLQYSNQIKLL